MIPLVFALLLAQDKATVEGTVVNALTNEPLKKVRITLDEGNTQFAVTSGSEGKFRFEGLEPGDYYLEASHQGFLDAEDGPPWWELAAGEHKKGIVIKMTPEGVIDGHVVDEDGDPVPGLVINAARTIHVNGRAVVLRTEGGGVTNNEGYFLVSELGAGRYYLSAEPYRRGRPAAQRGHPGTDQEFMRTDDPVPRDIVPGTALRNVEIHVRKSAVYRIRGRVSNPPKDGVGIRLLPPDGTMGVNDPQANLRDGAFEVSAVSPGSYVLSFENGTLFCHVPVTIADHDVEGIVAELVPGPAIEGTLKTVDGRPFAKPQRLQLVGNFRTDPIVAKEDGTFGWTNLGPKQYGIDYGPPDGYYVKSIQFNHQPVNTMRIDLSSATGGTLDIVVAPNAADLSVTIEGGKAAVVALWNDSTFHTWDTEADGTTTFEHLAPGEYRILAWQKVEAEFVNIPEFRARFDAQTITLTEGSHENIEVKLIPKSSSDAEIAKLQ
jgi:carboxypeptidase family protein